MIWMLNDNLKDFILVKIHDILYNNIILLQPKEILLAYRFSGFEKSNLDLIIIWVTNHEIGMNYFLFFIKCKESKS